MADLTWDSNYSTGSSSPTSGSTAVLTIAYSLTSHILTGFESILGGYNKCNTTQQMRLSTQIDDASTQNWPSGSRSTYQSPMLIESTSTASIFSGADWLTPCEQWAGVEGGTESYPPSTIHRTVRIPTGVDTTSAPDITVEVDEHHIRSSNSGKTAYGFDLFTDWPTCFSLTGTAPSFYNYDPTHLIVDQGGIYDLSSAGNSSTKGTGILAACPDIAISGTWRRAAHLRHAQGVRYQNASDYGDARTFGDLGSEAVAPWHFSATAISGGGTKLFGALFVPATGNLYSSRPAQAWPNTSISDGWRTVASQLFNAAAGYPSTVRVAFAGWPIPGSVNPPASVNWRIVVGQYGGTDEVLASGSWTVNDTGGIYWVGEYDASVSISTPTEDQPAWAIHLQVQDDRDASDTWSWDDANFPGPIGYIYGEAVPFMPWCGYAHPTSGSYIPGLVREIP